MVATAQPPVKSHRKGRKAPASASSRRPLITSVAVRSALAFLAALSLAAAPFVVAAAAAATADDGGASSCDASSPYPVTVTILPNGGIGGGVDGDAGVESAEADGETLTLPRDELARRMGNNLYNASGLRPDFDHIANHTVLYRPPTKKGTHFVYPSLPVGTRIPLPDMSSPSTGNPIELEVLSPHSPRVFYVHHFMSAEETDALIEFSTDESNPYKMARSTGGSHKSWAQGGREAVTPTRTSMNAYDVQSPTAMSIKQRAFKLLRIPKYQESMADGIQVLRYETAQAYVAHHDYFPRRQSTDFNWDPAEGGSNRFATVFLYLSDVDFGGHTCFPKAERLRLVAPNATDTDGDGDADADADAKSDAGGEEEDGSAAPALEDLIRRLKMSDPPPSEETLSALLDDAGITPGSWEDKLTRDCYNKFSVPPKKGDAVLFYSQTPDGHLDPTSLHGAGPVLRGTKWGANVWVWNACRFSMCKGDGMMPSEEQDFEY